ncbi:hypothetical protein D9M71_438370 [compost metagenome]
MQPDQPVANSATQHMPALDLLGQIVVRTDQRGEFQPPEGDGLIGRTEDHPAGNRHADHQGIQGPMHRSG